MKSDNLNKNILILEEKKKLGNINDPKQLQGIFTPDPSSDSYFFQLMIKTYFSTVAKMTEFFLFVFDELSDWGPKTV